MHAPQVARSQTFFAPVRSRWFLKVSSSVTRGSRFSLWALPLIRSVTATGPGPTTPAVGEGDASATRSPASKPPETATLAPFRKSRRVKASEPFRCFPFRFRMVFSLCPSNATCLADQFAASHALLKSPHRQKFPGREGRIIPPILSRAESHVKYVSPTMVVGQFGWVGLGEKTEWVVCPASEKPTTGTSEPPTSEEEPHGRGFEKVENRRAAGRRNPALLAHFNCLRNSARSTSASWSAPLRV